MSREKQIEEMASDFCALNMPCEECHLYKNICHAKKYATRAYNAGYRKASDVAEGHWYRHDKKKHGDTCYYCSVCEKMALADCMIWELTDYCPNCGAKMKGERSENGKS